MTKAKSLVGICVDMCLGSFPVDQERYELSIWLDHVSSRLRKEPTQVPILLQDTSFRAFTTTLLTEIQKHVVAYRNSFYIGFHTGTSLKAKRACRVFRDLTSYASVDEYRNLIVGGDTLHYYTFFLNQVSVRLREGKHH